jgi:hypothetical protein
MARQPDMIRFAARQAAQRATRLPIGFEASYLARPGLAAAFARRRSNLGAFQGDPFSFGKFLRRVTKPPKFIRKLQPLKLLSKAVPFAASLIPGIGGLLGQAAAGLLPQPVSQNPGPPELAVPLSGTVGEVVSTAREQAAEFDFASLTPVQLYHLIMASGIEVPGVTNTEVR